MMNLRGFAFLIALLCANGSHAQSPKSKPIPDAKPVVGAKNDLDVPYIPERLTGKFEDRWLKMNIHWPDDDKVHPCILFVHGGGYGGGDKDGGYLGAGGPEKNLLADAVKRGYVAVNLNYILGDGASPGIFPQVYWDFRTAVRFLRKNAAKYHIDPDRIGAMGFSAGGWLVGSSSYLEAGDLYGINRNDIIPAGRAFAEFKPMVERVKKQGGIFVPLDDPNPAHGEFSWRLQAVAFDFYQHEQFVRPGAPPAIVYVGEGGVSPLEALYKKAGIPFVAAALQGEKFKGLGTLHVPPLNSKTTSVDGKTEVDLQQRVFEFFQEHLVDKPAKLVPGSKPLKADLPNIVGPAKLASAKVGQPYSVTFETDAKKPVVWNLLGHLSQFRSNQKKDQSGYGFDFDQAKGVLSGTPTKPGVYTIMVQVAWEAGQAGSARTFVLVVEE